MESMMERYRVVVAAVRSQEEGEAETRFVARVVEIPGCEVSAATRAEAVALLEEELTAQLQNMEDQGTEIPQPIDARPLDGEIAIKVSQDLHRDLLFAAADAGVDLEPYLVELLSRSLRWRASPRRESRGARRDDRGNRRGGRRRGPQGQKYHDIMENRANFIEYVRQLDDPSDGHGGGRGSGGRGPGGRGRR